jgi:4-carboxymuconolactone decarboxylase
MDEKDIKARTAQTAKLLFSGGAKLEPPYTLWREFDRELANDFSRFITGIFIPVMF